MENQHRHIKGHRDLSEEEISAICYVKETGESLGKLVAVVRAIPDVDQRWVSIGASDLQTGIMALVRAIARSTTFVFALVVLAGCSSGLQERAFKNEHGVYIVSQSLVNDRMTSNQPHLSGGLACSGKYTSEQMAGFRDADGDHTWYHTCQPVEQYKPGMYQLTSDQPIATLYKGPVEAVILGAAVGSGLAMSGDTITQRGTSVAGAQATGQGGTAINKGRRR